MHSVLCLATREVCQTFHMSFCLVLQGKLFKGIFNVSVTLLVAESGFLNNRLKEQTSSNIFKLFIFF